jgi:hypothetical protein
MLFGGPWQQLCSRGVPAMVGTVSRGVLAMVGTVGRGNYWQQVMAGHEYW